MKLVLIDNMIALRLNRPVIIYNCSRPIPAATESVMKGTKKWSIHESDGKVSGDLTLRRSRSHK